MSRRQKRSQGIADSDGEPESLHEADVEMENGTSISTLHFPEGPIRWLQA